MFVFCVFIYMLRTVVIAMPWLLILIQMLQNEAHIGHFHFQLTSHYIKVPME